jgi:arsenite-transporting ATPase
VFGPAYLFGRQRKGPDEFEAMAGRMKQVRDLLTDPERVDFRVVCLPESMAVAETTRLVAQLSEMGVPVETVVVNRVLTDADPDCQRCRATQQAHQDQISQLEAAVPDREIVTLPAIRDDMTARETVNQIAHRLPNELVEQTA